MQDAVFWFLFQLAHLCFAHEHVHHEKAISKYYPCFKVMVQLTDGPEEPYLDSWIFDESWLQIKNDKFPNLSTAFIVKRTHVAKNCSVGWTL